MYMPEVRESPESHLSCSDALACHCSGRSSSHEAAWNAVELGGIKRALGQEQRIK